MGVRANDHSLVPHVGERRVRFGSLSVLRETMRRCLVIRARNVHPGYEGSCIPAISPFQGSFPEVTDEVRILGRPLANGVPSTWGKPRRVREAT